MIHPWHDVTPGGKLALRATITILLMLVVLPAAGPIVRGRVTECAFG